MKQLFDRFIKGEVAIVCTNKDEALDFLEQAELYECEWNDGLRPTEYATFTDVDFLGDRSVAFLYRYFSSADKMMKGQYDESLKNRYSIYFWNCLKVDINADELLDVIYL